AQGFDRIANAEGLLSLRETATTLKIPEKQFIAWMLRRRWLYRRAGSGSLWGYAERIKAGLLAHKTYTVHNDGAGADELRGQVCVTPLGLTALARRVQADDVARIGVKGAV
ncbi:phage antirepressor KilAC domain-containing protein, partial [Ventosimonas gracilis]|uniref:phage antirepressor KilAC domain-containing protein n=1 Tax=Ventosimonas gracilis TaxID=1680762 RepID=UPI00187318CB